MRNKETVHTTKSLNIVYYFDKGKTGQIKISLYVLRLLILFLFLLFAWSGLATYLFMKYSSEVKNLNYNLEKALNTLFQYQVNEEELYEKVYQHYRDPKTLDPNKEEKQ